MNADPRRPEKVQRYTPKTGNGTGEDLTPDYMNILGQQQTAGNMTEEKHPEPSVILEPNLQLGPASVDDVIGEKKQNVIPTSPQYGVAIIPNANPIPNTNPNPNPNEESVVAVENENTTTIATKLEDKELHSTPSRNDRFKVVKIASLEPFKRGRWKCMDYVDESPPNTNTNTNRVLPQSTYMQTQSLPQQQIQQMLLQTGTHPQFFTPQLIPQNQFFYPQNIPQQVPQFIGNQYFQNVLPNTQNFNIPQSYPNVQYIPIQNQNSAFVVPTSQPVQVQLPTNFQQSQSYAGIGVSQTNVVPLINGHGTNNEPVSNPTGKNVILTTPTPQPTVVNQTQLVQQQNPPTQQYQPNNNSNNNNPQQQINNHNQLIQSQSFDHQNLANNVYRNPQFTMSVNSLTVLENSENSTNLTETNSANANSENNIEDPSKSNPVVNAIDNKIEQAMDLVKSHLMYTVREEVEVLKEKIAELMEKIQQLETENNFLRSQIPKSQQQNNAGFSADGNNVGESGNSQ